MSWEGGGGEMHFKSWQTPNNQWALGRPGLLASNEDLVPRPHLVHLQPTVSWDHTLACVLVPLHLTELT